MTDIAPLISRSALIARFRNLLLLLLVCLQLTSSAQDCQIASFIPPDTLRISHQLGDCQISTLEVLDSLNLDGCANIQLIPSGPYDLPLYKSIVVYDRAKDSIYSPFVLQTLPEDLSINPEVTTNTDGSTTIVIPLGAGECQATKEQVLNQLNVDPSAIIRSQIHLIEGTARITEFSIGDTIRLQQVECGSSIFYTDVKVLFEPTVPTFNDIMTFDINLTTCMVSIADVLNRLSYDINVCDISRFSISDQGPFGYGLHPIDFIKLDGHFILKDALINVVPSDCDIADIDFGMLPEGKCALNVLDILDTLGLISTGCSIDGLRLIPDGPYETSPVEITGIEIDGEVICSDPFEVSFVRNSIDNELETIFCLEDLNIAMGPDCEVLMSADVILTEGGNYCYLNYIIDLAFAERPDDIIDSGHELVITQPGKYSLVITNPATGNSCWSQFNVEDKFIRDIVCTPDTLWCYESLDLVPDDTIGGGPEFPDLGDGIDFTPTDEPQHYFVSQATLCGVAFAHYEDILVEECVDTFKQVIDRLWTFEDNYGNGDTCTQRLYIRNSTLDLIDPFETFVTDCISDFIDLDVNGHPTPEATGYPMIRGLYQAGICGTLKMTYNDINLPLCGLGIKIIREWVIIDWCSDQVMQLNQIIRIEDKTAPEIIESLEDLSIDSDPFICGGTNIDLPLPAFDDCNLDEVILEVIYETYNDNGQIVKKSNGSSLFIDEIKTIDIVSTFQIEYILTDPCGNESRDTLALTISDNEPPVAVCDEFTIISVGGSGNALVRALTFDDLSVDNCGILKYEARKIEGVCFMTEEFAEDVKFCCEEVGDTLMVEFKVTDLAGNYNFCVVGVSIQDKFKPIINGPEDVLLDCGEDYLDLDITGQPTVRDNCDYVDLSFIDEVNLDQCDQGTIVRTWMVEDKGGFIVTYNQVITIAEDTLFYIEQVNFPNDTIVLGCDSSLDPEFTGKPIINTKSCALVDATHSDLLFYDVENACIKILREWTIIDWCQRDAENSGIWKSNQIIKLISDEGPVFFNNDLDTTYCITNDQCRDDITIRGIAEDGDMCTPADELIWSYDLYNLESVLILSGEGATVDAILMEGEYFIIYLAVDGCDNAAQDTFRFEVIDCQSPMLSCPSVQPSLLLNPNGVARLSVTDIVDIEIFDNCDETADLILSFAKDSLVDELIYTCDDLVDGVSDRFVRLFATDTHGNVDSCELFVQIRDNSDQLCGGKPVDTLIVAGTIITEGLYPVSGVEVKLISETGERTMITDETGEYSFDHMANGESYKIEFEKNNGHDNGVTTLDILLTQRHILDILPFESPYNVIAADANNNGGVSAIDLVRMRRIVIGLDSIFSHNNQKSWRFVDVSQEFESTRLPFPFIESSNISSLDESMTDVDFMAIKIGDVNGSSIVSSALISDIRTASSTVSIQYDADKINFYATTDEDLSGLQLQFENLETEDIIGIESGTLVISDYNYNLDDEGLIISWTKEEGSVKIHPGDLLFSILVEDAGVSEKLIGTQMINHSEWIHADLRTNNVEIIKKKLELPIIEGVEMITDLKNAPNPFTEYTNLLFLLHADCKVNVELFDLSGKNVYHHAGFYTSGQQNISIDANALHLEAGLYIVRINVGGKSYLHKMSIVR